MGVWKKLKKGFMAFFTLTPKPGIFDLGPFWAFLISFVGLYGVIHCMLLASGKPFLSNAPALEIGDPIISVGIGLAAIPLKKYRSKARRFYHTRSWYAAVAVSAIIANIIFIKYGATGVLATRSPLSIVHFFLVPIYATLVIGVIPHLLVRFKNYWLTTSLAGVSFATYAAIVLPRLGS